ncbi:MAG: alpha/beta hydrolase [Alphaproteobacteria bacterium]|nr:alpha/beta hydrolase [Alphaproteobacteria bacterium]
MTLHPQCQAVVEASAARGTVFDARNADEARALYAATTEIFAPQTPALENIEDRQIPGPEQSIPARLYRPKSDGGRLPILVYFHGGGWVFGDIDTHDALCRIVADGAGCLVASIDYRLAPEHKYPAGLDDCLAATRWMARNADAIGCDGGKLAVGGDSAGGNLAAAVAQRARDEGGPALVFQWLIYPALDFTADNASVRENGTGYLLTKQAIDWTREQYLADPHEEAADPGASPGLARELAGLPPALIQTAQYDPLRDEAKAYAERLAAAGVPIESILYDGMVHGFMRMGALIDCAGEALADGAAALRRAFSK